MPHRPRIAVAIALVLMAALQPALAAQGPGPAAVVTAFCDAISSRNLDGALAHFADGGVQFNLRPAHQELGAQPGLTSDLKAHWSMIGPVLFSATTGYTRTVEVLDTHVDGDLATVWTRTNTETRQKGRVEPRRDRFVEVYLLVRQANQWKIGAIADNRQPNPMAE